MKVSVLNKLLLLINRSFTMKKLILLVILAFSMVLSPLATTFAATPKVINYQGQLESNTITSQAPVLVVFELFEDAAGGSALWIEQKSVTVDKNGFFSVYLGDVNPIDLKFDKQYFVQVTVGNNQPFPRTKLSSTPSAFYAADADTATYAFNSGLAMDVAPKAIGLDNLADEVLTAGGDLMGMYPNPQIKPSAIIDNIPDGSITSEMLSPNISTSPSGPAGGDLFGSYPDPLIAVGAVKTDRIFDGAVTNQKIADGAVTNNKIVSLDAAKLTNVPALNYQVAVMTDATIDGDGTLAMPLGLADNAVSTSKIVDGAVTNAKVGADAITTDKIMNETILAEDIAAGAVTTSEILDETILAADIATGAVTTSEILNETILAEDIATGAVTTSEILDETILATDIATGAVTTSEILNSTILTEDLADLSVTNAKLADDAVRVRNIDVIGAGPANGDVLYYDGLTSEMRWGQENVQTSAPLTGNGTTLAPVTLDPTYGSADELLIRTAPSGWVSSKINTNNINNSAVTNAKLADNSVTTAKIMDGEVMTADIANLNVTTAKIADANVTTGKIADANVTTIKIADNAITTAKILDGDVMTADLANGSVTSAKILDGEVMTADLATNSVTTPKIADGSVTTAKILDGDVQTVDLANKAVTNTKIDEDAVTGNKVLNGSLSSLDLDATGVAAGIYGDPSALPSTIDVPEYKVDAQGRILTSKENSYTVISASTIFNESPVSDITVDGTYDNLDLQIKPGVVGTTELADNSVTSAKIVDGTIVTADLADNSITSLKIIDGSVTSADIADGTIANIDLAPNSVATGNIIDGTIALADMGINSVGTTNIIDNNVLNTKIGSGAQIAGKVLKADGAGNTTWQDDLGLTLPYTGAYPGPGDAFKLTHTGAAGNGSVAIFTSSTSGNTSDGVVINKGVDAGAGSALSVSGTGVKGTNYIAKFTNTNLAEGRTVLIENNAPVIATQITDPNGIPNSGDEFVTPDPTGTDLNDATLVVRNKNAAVSNQKLAIKTYGSIQANSTVQGTNLVAYGGQVTLLNPTTGAVATLMPPTNVGDPLNVTPALDIAGTSTVLGINNIWESFDGNLFPAGTGTNRDVPTALAVSNSIGAIAAEPFITFSTGSAALTNNRVFAVNSTLTKTIAGADNGNIDLSINLANPNTWTGTQTLSAAGNGLVVTTNSDIQGNIANSTGSVTVADDLVVNETSTLTKTATIGSAALNNIAVVADNNDGAPTILVTNNGAGSSINATGNVTINNGGLDVTGATNLNGATTVTAANTFTVGTGAASFGGTLTQTAAASQVKFAGNVDANNGLDVAGANLTVGTTNINPTTGNLVVGGTTTLNGATTVTGANTFATTTGQATFGGNVDANAGLDVTGNFTLAVAPVVPVNQIVTVVSAASTDAQLPTAKATNTAIAAVADAQFLTLAFDPDLSNERKATFSGNFTTLDNGANANYDIDLSNTIVGGSFGNATGTSYSTFTVDNKGRLTAAGTQAIVVDDIAASDISISGAASNVLDLQIDANVVTANELDETGAFAFTGLVSFTNIDVNGGAVDGAIIGANNSAAGTFTNLTAQTDFTVNGNDFAGNTTVDDIYTSVHFGAGPLITGDDDDLITAGAVAAALAATDLQIAYNNGNAIVTNGNNIDFTLTAGNFNVNGAGTANFGANVNATNGLDVTGANLTVGGANFTVTNAGVVNGVSATFTGNVEGATITEGGNAVPNVTEAPAAGDISGTYAAGFQIVANAVTPAEVAPGNYDTDLTAGSYALGNLDNTIIGAGTAAAGTFTSVNATTVTTTGAVTAGGLVSANAGLTVGAAQNFTLGGVSVVGIQTSAPLASDATDLVTEKAVFDALAAHTLQTAYTNGSNIVTAGADAIDFTLTSGAFNVNTTAGNNFNVNGAGTADFAANLNATNGLDVTGANLTVGGANFTVTPAGAVTQAGGNVSFGGPVAATNTLTVTGGANVAGGVNVSTGGVTIVTGDLTISAGNANISSNATVGGVLDAKSTIVNTLGSVTVNDDLVVTGTSDLRGVVSNSTGAVTVNDDVDFNLQAAGDQVGIASSLATGALLNVNNTNAGNTNYVSTVISSGTKGLSVTESAANGIGLSVTASTGTSTGANIFTSSASATTGQGTAMVLENDNAATDGTAKALEIAQGSVVLSNVNGVNQNATGTQGQYTVVEITVAGGAGTFPANAPNGTVVIYVNATGAPIVVGGTLGINTGEAIMAVKSNGNWYKIGG